MSSTDRAPRRARRTCVGSHLSSTGKGVNYAHHCLEKLRPPSSKRDNVVDEILETEIAYIKELDKLNYFLFVILKDENRTITSERLNDIFINLPELLESQNNFLNALIKCYNQPSYSLIDITSIFNDTKFISDAFKPYLQFCGGYCRSLHFAKVSEPDLEKYKDILEHPISFFTIMPVQRICRYPLLLNELSKHDDSPKIREAFSTMASIAKLVNDAFKESAIKFQGEKINDSMGQMVIQEGGSLGNLKHMHLTKIGRRKKPKLIYFFEHRMLMAEVDFSVLSVMFQFNQYHGADTYRYQDLNDVTKSENSNRMLKLSFQDTTIIVEFSTENSCALVLKFLQRQLQKIKRIAFSSAQPANSSGVFDMNEDSGLMFLREMARDHAHVPFTRSEEYFLSYDKLPTFCNVWTSPMDESTSPTVVLHLCCYSSMLFPQFFKRQMKRRNLVIFAVDIRGFGKTGTGGLVESHDDQEGELVYSIENGLELGKDADGRIRKVGDKTKTAGILHARRNQLDLDFILQKLREMYPGSKLILTGASYGAVMSLCHLENRADKLNVDGVALFNPLMDFVVPLSPFRRKIGIFGTWLMYHHRVPFNDYVNMSRDPVFQDGLSLGSLSLRFLSMSGLFEMLNNEEKIVFNPNARFRKISGIPIAIIESMNDFTGWGPVASAIYDKFEDKSMVELFKCEGSLHFSPSDQGDTPFMDTVFSWLLSAVETGQVS